MGKIIPTREDGSFMTDNSMMSGGFINHYGLFLPTLLGQASAEQQSWWVPRAITFKVRARYSTTDASPHSPHSLVRSSLVSCRVVS